MLTQPQTPTQRMAQFAAYLREHGLTVGPAEQQAMLKSLATLGCTKAQPVSDAWRSIACGNAREWQMAAGV